MAQLPKTFQPPPDLPNMPDISNTLSNYLRTFSLWCKNGFADKLSQTAAQPGILIQATDSVTGDPTNFVYLVGVEVNVPGSGAPTSESIRFTLIPAGTGKP